MKQKSVLEKIRSALKGDIVKDTGEPFFMNGEGSMCFLLSNDTILTLTFTLYPDEEVIKEVFQ